MKVDFNQNCGTTSLQEASTSQDLRKLPVSFYVCKNFPALIIQTEQNSEFSIQTIMLIVIGFIGVRCHQQYHHYGVTYYVALWQRGKDKYLFLKENRDFSLLGYHYF